MKTLESIVTTHPFVQTMKAEHLDLLCKNATEMELEPGEIIFRQGDPANRLFLIQSGQVAVEAHEGGRTVQVQTLGANELLGWSWLFPPFSWNFQARALEPTRLIVLDGAHLLVTCEENHDFGYELMKRMAKIVINRLQTTRRRLIEERNRDKENEKQNAV